MLRIIVNNPVSHSADCLNVFTCNSRFGCVRELIDGFADVCKQCQARIENHLIFFFKKFLGGMNILCIFLNFQEGFEHSQ